MPAKLRISCIEIQSILHIGSGVLTWISKVSTCVPQKRKNRSHALNILSVNTYIEVVWKVLAAKMNSTVHIDNQKNVWSTTRKHYIERNLWGLCEVCWRCEMYHFKFCKYLGTKTMILTTFWEYQAWLFLDIVQIAKNNDVYAHTFFCYKWY